MNVQNRTIFEGDNLDVLRGIDSECVDLIYLDPPFNSNKTYSAPIGSEAAGAAFKDSWTMNDIKKEWHGELAESYPELYAAIASAELTHSKSMRAYLIMMSVRMLEMKRILKPTGSIYLHCDPTANHYLKTMMDAVFGEKQFRNEIVWHRIQGAGKRTQHKPISYGRSTDHILFYAKSDDCYFDINSDLVPMSRDYIATFKWKDKKGRYTRRSPFNSPGQGARPNQCYEYKGFYPPHSSGWNVTLDTLKRMDADGDLEFANGRVYRKLRLKEGIPANNLWSDIKPALGKERLGYPTQKPLALLERIVKTSSNQNDIVLDPFCGCATTCVAAEKLGRQWVGIDISPKAVELVKLRLEKEVGVFGPVHHRTGVPQRTDTGEAVYQLQNPDIVERLATRIDDIAKLDVESGNYRTHKHMLYGIQEGQCNGCRWPMPFRNMTIDHIVPRSKGGTDDSDNLQLLCGACNSAKGIGTQEALITKLREEGTLR